MTWFKNIRNKISTKFIKFDIVDFYPSISEELLDKALTFAKTKTEISDHEMGIIKHARKALLFNNGNPWTKKNQDDLFDVTMGR